MSLCKKCARGIHVMAIGNCNECGKMVSSMSYKYCNACSLKLDKCGCCLTTLSTQKPENPADRRLYVVTFKDDAEPVLTRVETFSRSEILKGFQERTDVLSEKLKNYIDANSLTEVKITNILRSVQMCFINCNKAEADVIAKMPEVATITIGD